MAVPKKRISRTRRDRRRSHHKAPIKQVSQCSHCKQPKVAHRVCPHCGYYAGVEVTQPQD
jgi:large subunit ribosomal protein L32